MDMKINKDRLRREREQRAWTQSHLAEIADLSMRTVQRIERTGDASMESASALAAALNLELAVLLEAPPGADNCVAPKSCRYQWFAAAGVLGVVITLGWWSTASADPVKISLLINAEKGASSRGAMEFTSTPGEQKQIEFAQQFRLQVSTAHKAQGLLIATQVYDYINGDYRLVSSPAILVGDNQLSAIQISTQSSGHLELTFNADF